VATEPETTTTFTPGPWEAVEDEIVSRDDTSIALVPLRDGMNPTEWQANLHLIAAAPELFSSLREMEEMLHLWMCDNTGPRELAVLERCERALAKAEGRP
jgi:hypothetical protein